MIETFYGLGTLDTPRAFLAALLIGMLFGFALERAGFGSSRKLTGVFYFRDMAVFKVMFTALITGMLGLSYCIAFGWIDPGQLYLMPTVFGAQIVGGLLFGVGFVTGGWCPGTAVVGVASGKGDAVVFLGGTVLGSILFSEVFPSVKALYEWGGRGVLMVYDSVGMTRPAFIFLFSVVIVAAFWGSELVERKRTGSCLCFNTPFMRAFSVGLLALAAGLFMMPSAGREIAPTQAATALAAGAQLVVVQEGALMASVEAASDHMEPEELADRLMGDPEGITLVDVRPAAEFDAFHIRGAINVPLAELAGALAPYRDRLIVLYSNGMTHPAQARDSLARLGFPSVYILTDGLAGFVERCLKPASLRSEPLSVETTARINSWRGYFAGASAASMTTAAVGGAAPESLPGLVETDWLAARLGDPHMRVIDVRSQPEYNKGHLPGSVCMSPENVRGVVQNVSSMLMPQDVLARHLSLMGVLPTDTVVFVPGDKLHDATMAAMTCERLGHTRYGILNGGFGKWAAEQRPLDTALPGFGESTYPAGSGPDGFTVDYRQVLAHVTAKDATIIDVRPADYYDGTKSDEARAGHIPGAVNRPMTEDIAKVDGYSELKPVPDLAAAYAAIIPSKDSAVIVHCRTGHQASQTYFVLKRLLGYRKVFWYDGSWSEWSARPELPIVSPAAPAQPDNNG